MSDVTLATIANSLTLIFEDLITSQINRSTPLLNLLPTGPGEGKNLSWNARFGTDVGGARAEGADVVTFNNDAKEPASLDYGTYDDAFALTGKAMAAAMAAGNPMELENLYADELGDCVERLAKGIAQDLYTGSGATDFIHGLVASAGPLESTGVYANIDRSSFAQWASNKAANGGTPRALSFDIMRDMVNDVYDASGENVDLIVAPSAIWTKYGKLFNGERRFMQDIYLRGQKITLSGGFQALEFDGVPVVRDINCPSETMLFLSTRHIKVCQLPDFANQVNQSLGMAELSGTPEADLGQMSTGLSARINPLSRAGDKYKFQLLTYPQLKVRKCNAQGQIVDIDPTL